MYRELRNVIRLFELCSKEIGEVAFFAQETMKQHSMEHRLYQT